MSLKDLMLERIQALGGSPKRSLGQNFLVSEHVVEKIITAVAGFSPQQIVEIGPGLGALTDQLTRLPAKYVAIEMDRQFVVYHKGLGLEVHEADALQFDFKQLDPLSPRVLVSNLPYQIAASLVIERSLDQPTFDGMVLMFQKEVAQRIVAKSGDNTYGMLSVIGSTFWKINFLLEAGTRDFWPSPKVASRVLVFRAPAVAPVNDPQKYLRFIKAAFSHPRKILINNLIGSGLFQEERLHGIWQRYGWDLRLRPQQLSVDKYIQIFKDLG